MAGRGSLPLTFEESSLKGAWIIDVEPVADERGLFARTFCAREFGARALCDRWVQWSTSFNHRRGTLRGMHYQMAPGEETKLVRCTRGAIYDVIIDLRPESSTFRKWMAVTLSDENRRALYVPPGFAHGFQALTDGAEVFYQISEFYDSSLARGVRWDDAAFGIQWPEAPRVMSDRDQSYPDFA